MYEEKPLPEVPKYLRKCPSCGFIAVTSMVGCFRRELHGSGEMVLMIDIRNDHYGRLT
jgi:hypothetical protein